MSIESQGHFFTIYFPGFVCLCFSRPRYQVSVYRTIGPLVLWRTDGKYKKKTIWSTVYKYGDVQVMKNVKEFLELPLLSEKALNFYSQIF